MSARDRAVAGAKRARAAPRPLGPRRCFAAPTITINIQISALTCLVNLMRPALKAAMQVPEHALRGQHGENGQH
jgi:hypothetical protein